MRKNIFQILEESFDIGRELERINELFTDHSHYNYKGEDNYKSEYLVNNYAFADWKQRNRCINVYEMKETLGIDELVDGEDFADISNEQIMKYLEYVENILYIADEFIKRCNEKARTSLKLEFKTSGDFRMLRENLDSLEDHLNLELKCFPEEEMVLLVEKNAGATAVAEIMPDNDLSMKVIQYNHYLLKGDLKQKRNIILALADKLESKRGELKGLNKQFEDDLFYALNNVNLRHNNITPGDKNYHECIANLSEEDLEAWYDDVYQMELLAFLLMDHQPRKKKVKELKQAVGVKNDD